MSTLEVDKIIPQSGTNTQLGESGDTITVPSGATLDASNATTTLPSTVVTTTGTQTLTNKSIVATQLTGTLNNARLSSVPNSVLANSAITINGSSVSLGGSTTIETGTSWQSDVKTSTFTAVAGEGYFINTTGGALTVNLPAGSVGDVIELVDALGTFTANNLTISANGSEKIQNSTNDVSLTKINAGIKLVYSGSTSGWVVPTSNTGTSGPYSADFLVIAGGGGTSRDLGGGGGAGGYRASFNSESSGGGGSSESSIALTAGQTYTVTVGAGGAQVSSGASNDGSNSSISGTGITTITSIGGGGGGSRETLNGRDGGSGGGSPYNTGLTGGSGTANQGFDGGGNALNNSPAAGGGGAGQVGADNGTGTGGNGVASSITGSSVTRAGGGGGGGVGGNQGAGGSGGGGAGGNSADGTNGTANTGGGAGGGGNNSTNGAAGGSGIVILRMATANYSGSTTGSPTVTNSGTDTIITFTGDGSYTA